MKNPKISLVMTVFNAEAYIKKALDSILNQTYTDFEIIVVDDASTDETPKILSEYKIKNIRNQENFGAYKSANIGISQACGEYIARLDADDISLPDRFAKQVDFLNSNQDHILVGSGAYLINEHDANIGILAYQSSFGEILPYIFFVNRFVHSSIMFRKSFFDNYGGYKELLKAQDYEYYLRMLEKGFKLANIPVPLVKYRIHSQSISTKSFEEQEVAGRNIIKDYFKSFLNINISDKTLTDLRKVFLNGEYDIKFFDKIKLIIFLRKFVALLVNRFPLYKTEIKYSIFETISKLIIK